MKKGMKLAFASVVTLSTLFSTSCTKKKSEDPKPIVSEQKTTPTDSIKISPWYIFKNDTAITEITPYLSTKWKTVNPNKSKDTITVSFEKKFIENYRGTDLFELNVTVVHSGGSGSSYDSLTVNPYTCFKNYKFHPDYSFSKSNNTITYGIYTNYYMYITKINDKQIILVINNGTTTTYTLNKVII